jgi:N-acetylmuramoyl-L-alanine amidase
MKIRTVGLITSRIKGNFFVRAVIISLVTGILAIVTLGIFTNKEKINSNKTFGIAAPSDNMIGQKALEEKITTIIIDPGHGGKDPGASKLLDIDGVSKIVREKDIILSLSKLLAGKIMSYYPDKDVVLTRISDVFLSLAARARISNLYSSQNGNLSLFISLHVNFSFNPDLRGYQIYYLDEEITRNLSDKPGITTYEIVLENDLIISETKIFADCIDLGLYGKIARHTSGGEKNPGPFYVLRDNRNISVLIEIGFLSNKDEALLLMDIDYLSIIADGILTGINHFENYSNRKNKKAAAEITGTSSQIIPDNSFKQSSNDGYYNKYVLPILQGLIVSVITFIVGFIIRKIKIDSKKLRKPSSFP